MRYTSAAPLISFDKGQVRAVLTATGLRGGHRVWHDFGMPPEELLAGYLERVQAMRERNPDMTLEQAVPLALTRWADELAGVE